MDYDETAYMHAYTHSKDIADNFHTHTISFGIFFVQSGKASFFFLDWDFFLRLFARGDEPRFSSSELFEALDFRFRVSFAASSRICLMHTSICS